MTDENGPDDTSGPPEGEEEQAEEHHRVKPLFRFGRKGTRGEPQDRPGNGRSYEGSGTGGDTSEQEEASSVPVRPVRVVKSIPPVEGDRRGPPPPEEGEDSTSEQDTPFDVEEITFDVEETPFMVEEETPFVVEGEAPFIEDDEAAFIMEEEAPSIEEGEAPFDLVETSPASYEDMEETRWEEPVHDTLSAQEEAETGGEFEFRSEESPEILEEGAVKRPAAPSALAGEDKPLYHKYLKPDEDLMARHPAKGPATGFDKDMDADAGEIDFGIDLIDPSEHRKKRNKPPKKDPGTGPKKGVGGHDFDAEVDSRGTGAEVGVDFEKRRKRRL